MHTHRDVYIEKLFNPESKQARQTQPRQMMMMMMKTTTLMAANRRMIILKFPTLLLSLFFLTTTYAQLNPNFYRNTCPNVETLVRNAVQAKFRQTFVTAPATLRFFFHDCFVRVCIQ